MELKYLEPLKELSLVSDNVFEEWTVVTGIEPFNDPEEHRCVCCRKVTAGAFVYNDVSKNAVYLGSSCFQYFLLRRTIRDKRKLDEEDKNRDTTIRETDKFVRIEDLNEYSKRVLLSYLTSHDCVGCCGSCGKSTRLLTCEECHVTSSFCNFCDRHDRCCNDRRMKRPRQEEESCS